MYRRRFERHRARSAVLAALLVVGAATTVVSATGDTARAVTSHVPFGQFDSLVQTPGGFAVRGWAIDPDTTLPVNVDIYVDGRGIKRVYADDPRPDVARIYPKYGPNHGFAATLPRAAGPHTVCIYAIDRGLGTVNPRIGCRTITLNFNPTIKVNITQIPNGMTVSGWAFDPDSPRSTLSVAMTLDGTKTMTQLANQYRTELATASLKAGAYHGFSFTTAAAQGKHTVQVKATNVEYGSDTTATQYPVLNFNPTAAITEIVRTYQGAEVRGWATDPDTSGPVTVDVYVDGATTPIGNVLADDAGKTKSGHNFKYDVTPLAAGAHTLCVVARNRLFGTGPSAKVCRSQTLNFDPVGRFEALTRVSGSTSVAITGWALDPNTTAPINIAVQIDGVHVGTRVANKYSGVKIAYPPYGRYHGFTNTFSTSDWKHTVCVTAIDFGAGKNTSLGCKIVWAIHPKPPSAPRNVGAAPGYGAARVTWTAPSGDGGAPRLGYIVTSSPGGITVRVGASATAATVMGLYPSKYYKFSVVARNVAGKSPASWTPAVKTQALPPPQTTPAPVSTSRYTRNITNANSTELSIMRAEGAADARANPSGHKYLMLLDIGGQVSGGVLLSATTRFVSYANLVKAIKAYVAGYASAQRPSAPAVIALGTNNDLVVSYSTGSVWARYVVNPVRTFAAQYAGRVTIVGANDIEPGFSATYVQTKAWLAGYLGATGAPFAFNGSADGCSWTRTRGTCNNGWSAVGLYHLAAGAAPNRIINLPQIYNPTMAAQWKYISLTGVSYGRPRIRFGGPLTEWTACAQAGTCYSMTGHAAWTELWNQLQSAPALRIKSLPYSTDLRIDR